MNFEILLSTQRRSDLEFLKPMFTHNDLNDFNILIINQTTQGQELHSDISNIRVINSFETGSPRSRNQAILNAKGDICLMADDDIVYEPDFKQTILDAYRVNSNADLITFEATDKDHNRYLVYPDEGEYKKNQFRVNTYVISFKRSEIQQSGTLFNPHFGVGSTFPGSTEFLFMSNAWKNHLKMLHVSKFIAMHPQESSGKRQGSDAAVSSRTALRYRLYGWLSIPWLIKYIFNMTRFGYIRPSDFFHKFRIGLDAVKTYRRLSRSGDIN